MKAKNWLVCAAAALTLTLSTGAEAACPAAPVGTMDDMVLRFQASQGVWSGSASLMAGNVNNTAITGEGVLVYDSTANTLKLCDGTNWIDLADAGTPGPTSSGAAGYVQLSDGAGSFTNSGTTVGQQLFWDNTNKRLGIGTASPSAALDLRDTTLAGSGSLSGSALNIAQTWNTTGAPTALKVNVTSSANSSGARLIDLQFNGVSLFYVSPGTSAYNFSLLGQITGSLSSGQANVRIGSIALTNKSSILELPNTFSIGWSATPGSGGTSATTAADLALSRRSANVLALGNGTNGDYSGTLLAGNVGVGTATPAASALVDVSSTSKGFLPPRMTTAQRDAIATPAAGLIVYNTTTGQPNYFDGTSWGQFSAPLSGPISFRFTDQTGVPVASTVTSNAVPLVGFPGTLVATCAGCTAIARNGTWAGTTVSGFTSGDTISIRATSSASGATATTASATVGSTVSMPWTFTTVATGGPGAFAFADLPTATTGVSYTSDTVTLTGFSGTLSATCSNCTAISRNGGAWSPQPLAGFVSGDTIAVRMTAGNTNGSTVSTTVNLGSTVSSPWTITVNNGCGTTTIGAACPDGTIVAGGSPDGNVLMYATPCDAGMTWDSGTSSCTGTRTVMKWSAFGTVVTNFTSPTTGRANTEGLVQLVNADMPYSAALYCNSLIAHGHDDWYLPASGELTIIATNKNLGLLSGTFDATYYVSSREWNAGSAAFVSFINTSTGPNTKSASYPVRCVRR